MDLLATLFLLFVAICIFCAFLVGALMMVIGTIILMGKLIVWLAYVGVFFVAIGIAAFIVAKVWEAGRDYFS